jgi:hypothetical protein
MQHWAILPARNARTGLSTPLHGWVDGCVGAAENQRGVNVSNLDKYNRRGPEQQASPALRGVPLTVRAVSLFGGWMQTFGWCWLGFSLIFMWFLIPATDVSSLWKFSGDLVEGKGEVAAVESTGISEGGSDHSPGTPIYKVLYSYKDGSGRVLKGASYTLGSQYSVGGQVPVEYVAENTGVSRIKGARTSPLEAWFLIFVIFPVIGVVFVSFGFRGALRRTSLLANGSLARGKLKSKTPTNTKINNQTVYKLEYEFKADDGTAHRAIAKSHDTRRLEDEEAEQVLYDPRNPARNCVVDDLPAGITIGEDGRYTAPKPVLAALVLVPPALTIIGHGTAALLVFT